MTTDPFANAPCLEVDPEVFYPGEWRAPSSADDALAICGGCDARQACLDRGMRLERAGGGRYGIWGGTTPQQRATLAAGTFDANHLHSLQRLQAPRRIPGGPACLR